MGDSMGDDTDAFEGLCQEYSESWKRNITETRAHSLTDIPMNKLTAMKLEINNFQEQFKSSYNVSDAQLFQLFLTCSLKQPNFQQQNFQVGDIVEADWHGKGAFFRGKIMSTNYPKKCCRILYEEGDEESGVSFSKVRVLSTDESQIDLAQEVIEGTASDSTYEGEDAESFEF